uniref:Uncharacterized protein n=1 Tax=Anguilla anguilla TaxID=7936 RepID=A0A0E9VLZ4_ANGAN
MQASWLVETTKTQWLFALV